MLGTAAPSIGVYDKTKISTFGRVFAKTLSSKTCYGPGLTKFVDIQTDFAGAFTISGVTETTVNGRKFVCSTLTTGLLSVALYEIDFATGATVARGRIEVRLPNQAATTAVPRFIKAIDTGTTGWKIYIGTVASTVVINGGLFLVNKVDLADFSFSVTPTQFYMAQASDAKAVYSLQDPTAQGVAHALTTLIGGDFNLSLNQIITAKGTAATLSHDGFTTNVAPVYTTQTCTAATSSGSPTFTLTAHGYANNDMLIITANAPTAFTATGPAVIQTVYFVRNATANTFELSATSGGASINATSIATPTVGRAFGTSTNNYVAARKTGSISTGFVGTALLINACQLITPVDGPNAGVLCFFLATTSNFYCWPETSISAGATALPGNFGVNNLGNGIDYVAPTNVTATYSEVLGKIVYTSAAFTLFAKGWANNVITHAFGTQISTWLENNTSVQQAYFRGFVVSGLEVRQGWVFASINTLGQRGFLMIDGRSDRSFDHSYLISPVQDITGPARMKFISTLEKLYNVTDTVTLEYRDSNNASDVLFNSASGGWNLIESYEDLSISIQRYVQIRIKWDLLTFLSGIPAQIQDVTLGHERLSDMSEYWKGMATGSTDDSPSYTVYRQVKLFGSVPTWYHRGIDDSGNVQEFFNTVTHVSQFTHSLNDGVSWLAGVGPDQVGKRLRFQRASPSGLILNMSLKEI